ncbi:hypothetical protein UPYG_G00005030 [Umbra pygmaea]|uniref:Uncharacterized protein n=1 Tax=Umbra pygmaea TaxID=75934 RepID=A0ABD0WUD2_UMBPY
MKATCEKDATENTDTTPRSVSGSPQTPHNEDFLHHRSSSLTAKNFMVSVDQIIQNGILTFSDALVPI